MKTTKKILLSAAAVLAAVCCAFGVSACGEHEHEWGEWSVTTQATCETAGKKERVCAGDPSHKEEEAIPALGHNYGEWTEKTPATCTEAKVEEHICSNDGTHKETRTVGEALGHKWDNGTVTTQPTEDVPGVRTYKCTVAGCDGSRTEPVPELSHKHSYTGEWQKDGEKHWKVCDGAGCNEVGLSATHNWNSGTVTKDPTCSAEGVKTYTCGDCGATKTESVAVDATAHGWGEWTSKTAATCSAPAVEERVCSHNPAHKETRNVGEANPDAHGWGDWAEKTAATCTEAKVEERVCSHDGTHKETRTAGEALGHDFSWAATTKPTDNGEGVATKTCSHPGCEVTEVKTLPSLSTAGVYTVTDDTAKCEEKGTANYEYEFDGGKVSFTAETPATGHDWGEWLVSIRDDGGEATKSCKNNGCQEYKRAELPALSEKDKYVYENSATCEMPGQEVYVFVYEGELIQVKNEEVPAKGHSWGDEWTEIYPADCIHAAIKERVCGICDASETQTEGEVNPEAHKEETLNAVEETCSEDGLTEGKRCSLCHKILEEQTVIKAKGHSFSTTPTYAPNEGEGATGGTVSARCTVCSKLVVYGYDNVVNAASTAIGSPDVLSDGVSYVIQNNTRNYLSYTFAETGTYTIYWANLNGDKLALTVATFSSSTNAFIKNGSVQNTYLVDGCIFEGYNKATTEYKYYLTDEEGNLVLDEDSKKVIGSAQPGDYARFGLIKNNVLTAGLSGFSIVKLTFKAEAGSTIKLNINNADARYLIGVNKEPTIVAELCAVGAGNFTVKDTGLEFTKITEDTAGTYTFTAKTGTFKLYVNDEVYSDGDKDFFGYAGFRDRYLTVTLDADDEVKVVKVSGKASDNTVTIHEGKLEEPAESEYNKLELGNQTITLSATNLTSSNYEGDGEDATDEFYSFTATESGYYEISVADGVNVNVVIRVDRTHYTTVFDVENMRKHSGVIHMEKGEKVIIAFLNNKTEEFDVNIAACEEPITYLKVNEKLENVVFSGFETIVKLTVDESVAEGTYKITFKVSNGLLRSYIYFTVGEEIEVEDPYDLNNGVAAYVNADIAAGSNNTVGAGTSEKSDWDEDFTRTITVKAGDVIYLATTALTAGYVDVTLEAVAE